MHIQKLWQRWLGKSAIAKEAPQAVAPAPAPRHTIQPLDISPSDPLLAYFQRQPGVVEIEKLQFDSPVLDELKKAKIQLVAPLVSQGQLIGLLNLGPRMSEQEYSSDDYRMLNNLASQAAPAVRVAQLVQQQQLEARQLERMEQELRVARIVQETLLPRDLPVLNGWRLAAYWQPAQAIGGDFYDFIALPDGQIGIVIADVTDKGVPAALVMASTRSILRGAAERYGSPGQVLERVNNLLCPEIPPKMFVTCLYAIFDPNTGRFWFANAGHNLPSQRTANGVLELRARGMPLGLLPDMAYEEVETFVKPGDSILVYSDGLTEAHNPQREMFGYPRLHRWLSAQAVDLDGEQIVEHLKLELAAFTGPNWVQEDDVTLVLLERLPMPLTQIEPPETQWRTLAEFSVASRPGNERQAMEQVLAVVKRELSLSPRSLERLKTAVAEATMNAIEHGNGFNAELPAEIQVVASSDRLVVRIKDHGGGKPIPEVTDPDLQAKLEGRQPPRGWGLFLIKNMVDEMRVHSDDKHHTIELEFYLGGEENARATI